MTDTRWSAVDDDDAAHLLSSQQLGLRARMPFARALMMPPKPARRAFSWAMRYCHFSAYVPHGWLHDFLMRSRD